MNFLEDVVAGRQTELLHAVLARYGRGTFDGPAAEVSISRGRVRIAASYMYTPIVGQLACRLASGQLSVRGAIVSRADLQGRIEGAGLEFSSGKRAGVYTYKVSGSLSPRQLAEVYEAFWDSSVLLSARGGGVSLSTSRRIPKPNKMAEPSFTKLQAPVSEEVLREVMESIAPGSGISGFQDASVSHTIRIDEIVIPEELRGQPASVRRVAAKRRGVLKRLLTVDGRKMEDEYSFSA